MQNGLFVYGSHTEGTKSIRSILESVLRGNSIRLYAQLVIGGSGWPTSLRRRYTMLTLQSSGFESCHQQKEKCTLGRPLHRRCPNCAAGSKWKTGDVKPN